MPEVYVHAVKGHSIEQKRALAREKSVGADRRRPWSRFDFTWPKADQRVQAVSAVGRVIPVARWRRSDRKRSSGIGCPSRNPWP